MPEGKSEIASVALLRSHAVDHVRMGLMQTGTQRILLERRWSKRGD